MKKLLAMLCIIAFVSPAAVASSRDKAQPTNKPFKTQYIIGLNGMVEASWSKDTRTGTSKGNLNSTAAFNYGVSFEARMTRHSGLETGIYCRTMNVKGYDETTNPPPFHEFYAPCSQGRYLSIPLLYKFYSRILNVAVGFNYDVLISDHNHSHYLPPNDFGIQLKVAKNIKLYQGLLVEPFVMVNQSVSGEDYPSARTWLGGGVGIKYRF